MDTRLNTYMRVPLTAELHGTEYCIWEGVEPRYATGTKGLGLFATRQLPKGYCIPLGGIWRPDAERVSICKHPDRHCPMASAYFVAYRRPLLTEKGKRKRTEGGGVGHASPTGIPTRTALLLLARGTCQQQECRGAQELRTRMQDRGEGTFPDISSPRCEPRVRTDNPNRRGGRRASDGLQLQCPNAEKTGLWAQN